MTFAIISQNQVIGLNTALDSKANITGNSSQDFVAKILQCSSLNIDTLNGILKASSGSVSQAVAGTDYLSPSGNGSALTGLLQSQISGLTTSSAPTFAGLNLTSASQYESATLGSELLSSGDTWNLGSGWSGNFTDGFTHSSGGGTASVTNSTVTPTIGYKYHIDFVVTNRTTGNFTITFGGQTSISFSSSSAFGPTATTIGTLSINPSNDFNGKIVISIKRITAQSSVISKIIDSTTNNSFEIRSSLSSLYNIFIGTSSGSYNTKGFWNYAFGAQALQNNTTGYGNFAGGFQALKSNTTGRYNIAFGYSAASSNTTGEGLFALGAGTLSANTTGNNNIGIGNYNSRSCTTGNNLVAIGGFALDNITTSNNDIGIGFSAGRFIADGSIANQTSSNSIYIGYNTKASANGDINEIVIGYDAIGNGSNTATLGNSSITKTFLRGTLNVASTVAPALASSTGILGDIAFDSNYIYVCTATNTWKRASIATW